MSSRYGWALLKYCVCPPYEHSLLPGSCTRPWEGTSWWTIRRRNSSWGLENGIFHFHILKSFEFHIIFNSMIIRCTRSALVSSPCWNIRLIFWRVSCLTRKIFALVTWWQNITLISRIIHQSSQSTEHTLRWADRTQHFQLICGHSAPVRSVTDRGVQIRKNTL